MVSIPRCGCQGESFQIMVRIAGSEIIQEEEGIKERYLGKTKGSLQMDSGSLDSRLTRKDSFDLSDIFHCSDLLVTPALWQNR